MNEEMTERQAYWVCRRWNRWVEEYGYLTVADVVPLTSWSKMNYSIMKLWPKALVAAVRFRDFQRAPCTSTFIATPTVTDWMSFVPASSDLPHQALNASRRWRGESWGCTYEKETDRS